MKGEINFAGMQAGPKLATHQPDEPDAAGDGDEARKPQLLRRDRRKQARHLNKKSRGQCIDQPLDDQEKGKTCEQIRHGRRQLPAAGAAGAAGTAGAAGVPSESLK